MNLGQEPEQVINLNITRLQMPDGTVTCQVGGYATNKRIIALAGSGNEPRELTHGEIIVILSEFVHNTTLGMVKELDERADIKNAEPPNG